MNSVLQEHLKIFQKEERINSKGSLAVVLYLSRLAQDQGLPLNPDSLVTEKGGQARGLGVTVVNKILQEHSINRRLAKETDRTSRGSMELKVRYINFLNALNQDSIADLSQIESWWIERIKDYFNARPFRLHYDTSVSFRTVIKDLLGQAAARRRENPGMNYAGIILQHLVAAKLSLILPPNTLNFHGASIADASTGRQGDIFIDDVVIHCTNAPSEALIEKCGENLRAGLRPMIITVFDRVFQAELIATDRGMEGRIDVLGFEQFIASNVYELSQFKASARKITVGRIIEAYNQIVSECENDPSLRVELG
jgi:hypothetical protein